MGAPFARVAYERSPGPAGTSTYGSKEVQKVKHYSVFFGLVVWLLVCFVFCFVFVLVLFVYLWSDQVSSCLMRDI